MLSARIKELLIGLRKGETAKWSGGCKYLNFLQDDY